MMKAIAQQFLSVCGLPAVVFARIIRIFGAEQMGTVRPARSKKCGGRVTPRAHSAMETKIARRGVESMHRLIKQTTAFWSRRKFAVHAQSGA